MTNLVSHDDMKQKRKKNGAVSNNLCHAPRHPQQRIAEIDPPFPSLTSPPQVNHRWWRPGTAPTTYNVVPASAHHNETKSHELAYSVRVAVTLGFRWFALQTVFAEKKVSG